MSVYPTRKSWHIQQSKKVHKADCVGLAGYHCLNVRSQGSVPRAVDVPDRQRGCSLFVNKTDILRDEKENNGNNLYRTEYILLLPEGLCECIRSVSPVIGFRFVPTE